MKGTAFFAIGLAGLAASAATQAAPQYGSDPQRGDQLIRCESNDNRIRRCAVAGNAQVHLARKLSDSPCEEGRTWGRDAQGIWVTQGCRGEFGTLRNTQYRPGDGYGSGVGGTFRCESTDNRTRHCNANGRNVQLVRQLSDSPCVEGRTWGRDGNGVWVSDGCRAEFASSGRGDSGWGGGWNGGNAQTIRCESDDGRYRQCSTSGGGRAQLIRQLSSTRCVEGQNWGSNRDGVWVDRGCRAEFSIGRGGWGGGPGYGDGSSRTLRCESNDNRTHHCNADVRYGVRLQRQLSDSACVQGRSWGWDRDGIWVSNGCRGEFSVN